MPTSYEERYAIEMIANGAALLGGHMEVQQKLDGEGFRAYAIVITLPDEDQQFHPSAPFTLG